MKVWRIEEHGDLEVLKLRDMEIPKPGANEALLKVRAVGMNHLDLWVRKGVEGHEFPLPITPGCDIVGEVQKFGSLDPEAEIWLEEQGLELGDSVIVNPMVSREFEEFPPTAVGFGLFGETQDGGLSEYFSVPVNNLIAKPQSLSFEEAACFPIAATTAYSMVYRKAKIREEEWVLIHAAGSGVSSFAIQLAKQRGAVVVSTVGDEEKIERAHALGCDYVINYKQSDFRKELRKILPRSKRGVDVVIDHIGQDTFLDSLKSLDWGGRLVTCGATTGSQVEIDLKPIFFKNISIFGSTMGSRTDFEEVIRLARRGELRAEISKVFPFVDYPEAQEYLETRMASGKVVIRL